MHEEEGRGGCEGAGGGRRGGEGGLLRIAKVMEIFLREKAKATGDQIKFIST